MTFVVIFIYERWGKRRIKGWDARRTAKMNTAATPRRISVVRSAQKRRPVG